MTDGFCAAVIRPAGLGLIPGLMGSACEPPAVSRATSVVIMAERCTAFIDTVICRLLSSFAVKFVLACLGATTASLPSTTRQSAGRQPVSKSSALLLYLRRREPQRKVDTYEIAI